MKALLGLSIVNSTFSFTIVLIGLEPTIWVIQQLTQTTSGGKWHCMVLNLAYMYVFLVICEVLYSNRERL